MAARPKPAATKLSAAAVTALAALTLPLLVAHCDNGATGVEACRQIESKRCSLAMGCPGVLIETEADVIQCQQLYRDQCIFGMADGADPDQPATDRCLAALDAAAACKGAATLAACDAPPELSQDAADSVDACLVIMEPERLLGCNFLIPPEAVSSTANSSGAGGTGGAGGAGGAGGQGGGS